MTVLLRPLLVLFFALTLLTGVVYPLLVTGIGRAAFPAQAAGSLVVQHGLAGHDVQGVHDVPVGSSLIAQSFQEPKYFWGRLSATTPMPNNASASGGSNLGPTNPTLLTQVKGRIEALKMADPGNALPVPVDLVTASASGLDPQVSPAAALFQVTRVARVRHLDPKTVRELVIANIEGAQWGVFGEPRVNVLQLNLALDRLP